MVIMRRIRGILEGVCGHLFVCVLFLRPYVTNTTSEESVTYAKEGNDDGHSRSKKKDSLLFENEEKNLLRRLERLAVVHAN